jgi:hypothetical protein
VVEGEVEKIMTRTEGNDMGANKQHHRTPPAVYLNNKHKYPVRLTRTLHGVVIRPTQRCGTRRPCSSNNNSPVAHLQVSNDEARRQHSTESDLT